MKNLKETFKQEFIKGATSQAKEEMADWRRKTAKEINLDEELVTCNFGYYLVLDLKTEERLDESYFVGNGKYPTRKDTFEVYQEAKNKGLDNFIITWQTDGHFYETYADKFASRDEPTGDGTDTVLLITI
tara:strand:+ start:72 stop:461 length:390 start_codon:yes stop_codon:yes gene_type:complete